MSTSPPSDGEPTENAAPSRAPIDRARLARIFGDVFPDTTADERGPDDTSSRDERGSESDEWLRRQKPPHHG
ncbi:hypothetical protein CBI38_23180 [Rhodococcus oxybenzonivorans]|uniref:Uncharacterized protein n=1 Tax=Rhodococcus oxybenzonivorans TaxID=1990687 RepID=A0A2S2C4G3_9NOCA|nr:hypothetical protein CBI38_23180 [Rhodococcus oxybenzonivorans]